MAKSHITFDDDEGSAPFTAAASKTQVKEDRHRVGGKKEKRKAEKLVDGFLDGVSKSLRRASSSKSDINGHTAPISSSIRPEQRVETALVNGHAATNGAATQNGHTQTPHSSAEPSPKLRRKRAVDFFDDDDSATARQVARTDRRKIQEARSALPIAAHEARIRQTVRDNAVVVLLGETGSGKSTQVPQFLLDDYPGAIAVTQPRRVAAVNLARRVADERACELGGQVGYSIRFDDRSSHATRIKYLTDGMLLIELMRDPLLSSYSVVVLDEAHERSLLTDLLLGFMKALLRKRMGLKVVVMSATLDAQAFSTFFDDAEILAVEGRSYPVSLYYTKTPLEDYVDAVLRAVFQVHLHEATGDVLVFLTGSDEIEQLCELVRGYAGQLPKEAPKIQPLPLYAALSQSAQQAVFDPPLQNCRKVVFCTNIAETSVTVPGVRYVVDCGLQKQRARHPKIGVEELKVVPLARSNADQRAGRAGREAAGKCWRLYTEDTYDRLPAAAEPEIRRVGLASAVLAMKARGVDDVLNFDYLDPPDRDALVAALEELYSLGALDDGGAITELGGRMAAIPLTPALARVLIAAEKEDCTAAVVDIVAALSVDNVFVERADARDAIAEARKRYASSDGDHLTYLNVVRAYLATAEAHRADWCADNFVSRRAMRTTADIRAQLLRHVGDAANMNADVDPEAVLRAFLAGYVTSTAFLTTDGSYRTTTRNQAVAIHPSSTLHGSKPEAIVFTESALTTRLWVRGVSRVQPSWLADVSPGWSGRRST